MKKKVTTIIVIAGTMILLGIIVYSLTRESGRTQSTESISNTKHDQPVAENARSRDFDTVKSSSSPNLAPSVVEPDPVDTELLVSLRSSFDSGSLPSRIRLQGQLDQYWEENPPSAKDLTTLINDSTAATPFRVYMTKVFRNKVKMHVFDVDAASNAFVNLRDLITNSSDTEEFRANIANILTTVDQSDEAILAVAPLLQADDKAAATAVSALLHTTNPLAVDALYDFVTSDENLIETKPQALMAALPPLSTTEKDILPVINLIVNKSGNFDLYYAAIRSLIHTPSSSAVLESVVRAYAVAPRFGPQQVQAEYLCRAAARKHLRFFLQNKTGLDAGTLEVIQRLLDMESVQ